MNMLGVNKVFFPEGVNNGYYVTHNLSMLFIGVIYTMRHRNEIEAIR